MSESIDKAYKPWLLGSLVLLVGALLLLIVAVTLGFVTYGGQPKPIWLILLSVVSMTGIGLGFAGFFGMMMAAGWRSFRETRRVQILPPDHQSNKL